MANNTQIREAVRGSPVYGETWPKDWHIVRQGDTRAGKIADQAFAA
jgi:hypothetical protein